MAVRKRGEGGTGEFAVAGPRPSRAAPVTPKLRPIYVPRRIDKSIRPSADPPALTGSIKERFDRGLAPCEDWFDVVPVGARPRADGARGDAISRRAVKAARTAFSPTCRRRNDTLYATAHRINKTTSSNLDMERKFSIDEIGRRLELALKPAEGPLVEEVLEHVSTRGVLRGSVDWVFPAWIAYVEYATQEIMKTFQLTEEERRQLLDFRGAMKRLLPEAQRQAKERLTTLYNAIIEGTYRMEGNKLYAPDGAWMYAGRGVVPHIIIHGVSASARFPDVLKLPHEKLELLQLGWRASDEYDNSGRPGMRTTQPWQVLAWTAARYGALRAYVASVILTREGVSVSIRIKARGWRQRWSKDEAIDLVASHLRRGEWAPSSPRGWGTGRLG